MDEYFDNYPEIPIMWVTGWYEVYARSIVDGYREMLKRGRRDQYLVAGPWTHANWDPYNGDANYGAAAGVIPPQRSGIPRLRAAVVQSLAQRGRERRAGPTR